MAAASVNMFSIEQFTGTGNICEYLQRLKQIFIVNDLPDIPENADKRKAILLSSLSSDVYSTLSDICSPVVPSSKTFAQITDILKQRYEERRLVIAESYRFNEAKQGDSESVTEFACRLQKLASSCDFGDYLQRALRDRFVSGICSATIQGRLLSKEHTFEQALKEAQAIELAQKDLKEIQRQSQTAAVNYVHSHRGKQHGKRGNSAFKQGQCYRCEGNHSADKCKFKDAVCHFCSKSGHIVKACLKKKNSAGRPSPTPNNKEKSSDKKGKDSSKRMGCIKQSTKGSDSKQKAPVATMEQDNDSSVKVTLNSVEQKDNVKPLSPILVNCKIEGVPMSLELDTGAAVSIMSVQDFYSKLKDVALEKTDIVLEVFTGDQFKPLGVATVDIEYNGCVYKGQHIYIVNTQAPPIFGRDLMSNIRLDWHSLKIMSLAATVSSNGTASTHLTLENILKKHETVFSPALGLMKGVEARLTLKDDAKPVFHKARPVAFAKREKVNEAIDKMVSEGVLEPVKYSAFASPIVAPWKKNNTVRICGDFKVSVNPQLVVEQYPLPRIDDIFASLSGGKKFAKIDLSRAYHQISVHPDDRELLTINTPKGLFRFTRLPEGIASAPAIWQRAIDTVLQGIPGVQSYLDDLIISGKDEQSVLQTLDIVLARLADANLCVNVDKCVFMVEQVEYCGHLITAEGLQPTEEKVYAVHNFPKPTCTDDVKSFCGFISYYRKFIPNCSTLMKPLSVLLQKNVKFRWGDAQEKAFSNLKAAITSESVLHYYDPEKELRLSCDASSFGVGAVLSHVVEGEEKPIAFASATLNEREQAYSQIDKEALGIIWAIKHFNLYLEGRHFTLVTDHKPLTHIFSPSKGISSTQAQRLQRWALSLMGYDFQIVYKKTSEHGNADGLSRLPLSNGTDINESEEEKVVNILHASIFNNLPVTVSELKKATKTDSSLLKVYHSVCNGWPENIDTDSDMSSFYNKKDELTIHDGCIMWGDRVVVPQTLQKRVLVELHEAHLGVVKMKGVARSHVWWPKIEKDIENMVKNCQLCKSVQNTPTCSAKYHHWEVPVDPWYRIHIDFAGPFKGHMFLVVVDASTKWPEVIVMSKTNAENTIAELRTIFARLGLPKVIVSDNGPQFISDVFASFCKENDIQHIRIAPYRPQTNGIAERMVQSLKQALKTYPSDMTIQAKVDKFLLGYRTAPHCTTGQTPSFMLFKREIRTRISALKPDVRQPLFKHPPTGVKEFDIDQYVQFRWYNSPTKWKRGVVKSKKGRIYEIQSGHGVYRRHSDQIIALSDSKSADSEEVFLQDFSDSCDQSDGVTSAVPTNAESSVEEHSVIIDSELSVPSPRYPPRIRKKPSYFKDYYCN